jgi:hypothetical protein
MNYKNLSDEDISIQKQNFLNQYNDFLQQAVKIAEKLKFLRQNLENIDEELECRHQVLLKDKSQTEVSAN